MMPSLQRAVPPPSATQYSGRIASAGVHPTGDRTDIVATGATDTDEECRRRRREVEEGSGGTFGAEEFNTSDRGTASE